MKERITNVMFNGEDRITIVTTEDELDQTFTYYGLKDNWACGVAITLETLKISSAARCCRHKK